MVNVRFKCYDSWISSGGIIYIFIGVIWCGGYVFSRMVGDDVWFKFVFFDCGGIRIVRFVFWGIRLCIIGVEYWVVYVIIGIMFRKVKWDWWYEFEELYEICDYVIFMW